MPLRIFFMGLPPPPPPPNDALHALIEASQRIVAFTGAGISTECGVPDFRSPDSPWMKHRPIDFQDFIASEDMRAEAWRRKFVMDDLYAGAKPGRGHRALAQLAARGRLTSIITQNIDGLHQGAAPHSDIIELHGNGTYATCLACGERHELSDVRKNFNQLGHAPRCDCGGIIKSATVSFGQSMPVTAMARARAAALDCDLMLAIGSSLVVHPAAQFPVLAKQAGARLVIINNEATPLDSICDLVLRGDIGAALARYSDDVPQL